MISNNLKLGAYSDNPKQNCLQTLQMPSRLQRALAFFSSLLRFNSLSSPLPLKSALNVLMWLLNMKFRLLDTDLTKDTPWAFVMSRYDMFGKAEMVALFS